MHVPLAQHQNELLLRELRIDEGKRNTVEGKVPGCIPGVLPFVGHGDDVRIVEMAPFPVSPVCALSGRRWLSRIAIEPLLHDVVIELLGPQHPG